MQIAENPLTEAYKTIRRYGTIVYDNSIETETGHSRHLSITYKEQEYMIKLKNGEVKSIRIL